MNRMDTKTNKKRMGTILNGDGKLAVELLILWKSCFIINE
jgi:hypothetical protein